MNDIPNITARKLTENMKGFFNNIKSPIRKVGVNKLLKNTTVIYSPVTLNEAWPSSYRLALFFSLLILGSLINGFFVGSFFVKGPLRRRGNIFMACTGLADAIISTLVMLISIVVLISSGQLDWYPFCISQQILTEISTYCYNLSYMLAAFDNYFRLCNSKKNHTKFKKMGIKFASAIFITSCLASFIGVYFQLDYDYCKRRHSGRISFRYATFVLLHFLPIPMTFALLYSSYKSIRASLNPINRSGRRQKWEKEYLITKVKTFCYVLFVAAWMPYCSVVYTDPTTPDAKFYWSTWLGVARSIITNSLFPMLIPSYRQAFEQVFLYIGCRKTLDELNCKRRCRRNQIDSIEVVHQSAVQINDNGKRVTRHGRVGHSL